MKVAKSTGPSKVYKDVYIPPDDKHKGFYRRYLVNTDSEKFARIKARAEAGGAVSHLYKLYLNFVKLLENHHIPNDPRESHNKLMAYKAKLIKTVALGKVNPPSAPVFAFSDYTNRRLEEARIVTNTDWVTNDDGTRSQVTTRLLQYPGEKNTPEFDLDPKDEVIDFVNKNLVDPLKSLSGKVKDHRGLDLDISSVNRHHFYQRAEFRISQYVEQYITEKHYHDLRMTLGYDIRDPEVDPAIKAKFEEMRDIFEQHIRDDIDANADAMAKELCERLVDTVKNPLWLEAGNNSRQYDDKRKEGTTEFHSKDFTVIVAHSGTLMTFWPKSAGERFAIEQGWRGATKNPSSNEPDVSKSQWTTSSQRYHNFRDFNRQNFAVGYYPEQPDLKNWVWGKVRYSNNTTHYPDNYFIKRSQYEQYSTKQLMEIAKHHNIGVPEQADPNQIIDTLISNSPNNVCWDMEGEYKIPPMMQYDSTLFTDYDFAEPQPRRPSQNNGPQQNNRPQQSNNNRRPPQNSRNPRRNAESTGRGSSISESGISALLALRSTLPH